MDNAGVDVSQYRDPWGRPYRLTTVIASSYRDRVNGTTIRVFGGSAVPHTDIIPVTQRLITFALRSAGPDGVEDTYDDFDIARFSTLLEEEPSAALPGGPPLTASLLHGTGSIAGIVTDASGSVVPGARVVLIDGTQTSYETMAGVDGGYVFSSVPAGVYTLRVSKEGFRLYEFREIPVAADKGTGIDVELQVGTVSEQVTVSADVLPLNGRDAASLAIVGPTATPRVREYFPETLVWMPEIITDARGAARKCSSATWRIT